MAHISQAPALQLPQWAGRASLLLPAALLFFVVFLIPIALTTYLSFNPSMQGRLSFDGPLTLANYERIVTRPLYYGAIFNSVWFAVVAAALALVLGYPVAYVIARTRSPRLRTTLTVVVLSALQLDMVIRLYGLMVLLGDNGLINQVGGVFGIARLQLMYNPVGVIVGLLECGLPFMILALVPAISNLQMSLEEAARGLGATPWQAFRLVVVPMTMPAVLAGALLVFAISLSSYTVPSLMGGWKVLALPMHIYQQISEVGRWQLGAALAVTLFAVGGTVMLAIAAFMRRLSGGRA